MYVGNTVSIHPSMETLKCMVSEANPVEKKQEIPDIQNGKVVE